MSARPEPIAIVGMACRYPDAAGLAEFWEVVLERRRAFRRLPAGRLELADYWDPDPAAPDRTYSSQAAVLDGWRFDRAAFRIPGAVFRSTDPAHWLALETAAGALADAGHPDGTGLDRERAGVVVGNSLTGEVTRARAMRLRWPYVRRILETELPGADRAALLDRIARRYLAPFPPVGEETLAGGLANTIAGRICNHFDLHGGGYTVDGACASALLAVITMCRALRDREVDFGIAGGVDLSLDPFELVGFAKAGALATDDMRVYDERSAGFWPGEGCGMLALMRADDAAAAGIPVYAEILGWGVSSDGHGGITRPEVAGQLRALRRASAMAGVEHADIGLYEGHGTGTAVGDLVELTALNQARGPADRARAPAAVGSVKANIGHTKAAAGVAGVIKATLSLAGGVLPPATGCGTPHPALGPGLRVLAVPEPWPAGRRLAGVSAMGFGGINTHLILGDATGAGRAAPRIEVGRPAPEVEVFALSGRDPAQLTALLRGIGTRAPELSLAELHDLACQYGRATPEGPVRAAVLAGTPAELAARAGSAADLLAGLAPGRLRTAPGVWLGNEVAGRVTALLPGQGAPAARQVDTAVVQPAVYAACRAAIAWLDRFGVLPTAAVGHSLGEIAALVWAGCLSAEDGARLVAARGRIMAEYGEPDTGMCAVATDPAGAARFCHGTGLVVAAYNGPETQVLSGSSAELRAMTERAVALGIRVTPLPVSHGFHSPAMARCVAPLRAVLNVVDMRAPARSVLSTVYGRPLSANDQPRDVLADQLLAPVLFWPVIEQAATGADLFCAVAPGQALAALAGAHTEVPAVTLDPDRPEPAVAALFAASAAKDVAPLFAGRSARPFDLWRKREFLTNPCAAELAEPAPMTQTPTESESMEPGAPGTAGTVIRLLAEAMELDPALIRPDARLAGELNVGSLRATQLLVDAAGALGRRTPAVPVAVAELTVAELIATIDGLPVAADGESGGKPVGTVAGIRPWLRIFREELVPAGDLGGWRPTESVYLPDAGDLDALLAAARTALRAGTLVVITHDAGLDGFFRSLCQEHPEIGITLVRTPPGDADPGRFSAAPGRWRELVLGADGELREPVERALPDPPPDAEFPLSANDVLLVSGGGRGIGQACARALALANGPALAVIGRADPDTDETLRANLAGLRAAGVRVAYRSADLTRPDTVRAAVETLAGELGPITAVLHAAGINEPAVFERLDAKDFLRHRSTKVDGLRALLAATNAPRLVVSFGSVIGRFGLPGECHYALANGALRAEMANLAVRRPDCRVLHVDWSMWSGTGMAERLGVRESLAHGGVTPISVAEGTELFRRLLGAPTPSVVSVHGRLGRPAPDQPAGRFLARIAVWQPDVEVVADSVLCPDNDAYLADHRLDGVAVLPGVLGLEAMAQAAALLAGRALTTAERVGFEHPVVIPDGQDTTIRVCALRDDDRILAVLRSARTGFRIDHCRAEFPLAAKEIRDSGIDVRGGRELPAGRLYGPVYFHTGRYRRVDTVWLPGPRASRATITEDPDEPGFTPVLGSPFRNDATVHVLQACVPHRRLLPVGCDRVTFASGARGPVDSHGVERHAEGGVYTWDVSAVDVSGRSVVRWTGLRLRDAGGLAVAEPWPAALLAVLLARCAVAVGLDPSVRVSVTEPFAVRVAASCTAVADWESVAGEGKAPDREVLDRLTGPCAEPAGWLAARTVAMTRCLTRLGRSPAGARFVGAYDGGWVLLGSGTALVASVIVPVAGRPDPVAIALLTDGAGG